MRTEENTTTKINDNYHHNLYFTMTRKPALKKSEIEYLMRTNEETWPKTCDTDELLATSNVCKNTNRKIGNSVSGGKVSYL